MNLHIAVQAIEDPQQLGIVRAEAGPAALAKTLPALVGRPQHATVRPGEEPAEDLAVAGQLHVVPGHVGLVPEQLLLLRRVEAEAVERLRGAVLVFRLQPGEAVDPEIAPPRGEVAPRLAPHRHRHTLAEILDLAALPVHQGHAAGQAIADDDLVALRGEQRPEIVVDLVEQGPLAAAITGIVAKEHQLVAMGEAVGAVAVVLQPDQPGMGADPLLDPVAPGGDGGAAAGEYRQHYHQDSPQPLHAIPPCDGESTPRIRNIRAGAPTSTA